MVNVCMRAHDDFSKQTKTRERKISICVRWCGTNNSGISHIASRFASFASKTKTDATRWQKEWAIFSHVSCASAHTRFQSSMRFFLFIFICIFVVRCVRAHTLCRLVCLCTIEYRQCDRISKRTLCICFVFSVRVGFDWTRGWRATSIRSWMSPSEFYERFVSLVDFSVFLSSSLTKPSKWQKQKKELKIFRLLLDDLFFQPEIILYDICRLRLSFSVVWALIFVRRISNDEIFKIVLFSLDL